jgi:hypothetical protein
VSQHGRAAVKVLKKALPGDTAYARTVREAMLQRLRDEPARPAADRGSRSLRREWSESGVAFASEDAAIQSAHDAAVRTVLECIHDVGEGPVLHEGAGYRGCWLESTGTISAEVLSRFLPSVARATFAQFARHQRVDGLLPYKVTADGPAFSQIQLVTPPARSVWNAYLLTGRTASDREHLSELYRSLSRYDEWLVAHRMTRGTGCLEAFAAFDTGHDNSPRFWHCPDVPFQRDAARCDPESAALPYLAPDLTATLVAQRRHLALMAAEFGDAQAASRWRAEADDAERSLMRECFDEADGTFYDRDRGGAQVRVQSDVLLRVLSCGIGDDAFFDEALRRHVLNTRKFFARYPFTSIALDDPRFDQNFAQNSWGGPTNLLTLLRAPHAFDQHGRHVELGWAMLPTLSALVASSRFPQTLDPFSGTAGFGDGYSPAALCLLDFVERLCGILPRPDGTLWFSAAALPGDLHGARSDAATGYARTVDGVRFELVRTGGRCTVLRDGQDWMSFPDGVRVVTDRAGTPRSVIGMTVGGVRGALESPFGRVAVDVGPNDVLSPLGGESGRETKGVIAPTH